MPEGPTEATGQDWRRVALIVGCVLAALVAALVVPALGSDGIRGSPIDTVLPGERFSNDDAGSGEFGALNPGDTTGVGGETGFDRDTFGNNDTEVHFEVESSESAYWRTGTYGRYTGTGWERDPGTTPYDGPLDYEGGSGEELVYEVELMKPASTLPTAWRPVSVSGVDSLSVTETGSIQTDGTLESGSSFSGVSRSPERDIDILRTAGQEYPTEIEQRYTQLPSDTPGRVEEFTQDLTADDNTPYDTAMTIQNWLRSEKGYSLAADEQSEHIADTFIFEMEEGYCEYFATSMTTMLRTQGIPARYTVGYTTGQEVSENRYQVRGMNAHAWVEVYFPDVGWVRFDPTPGDSRLANQEETLESEQPDLDYEITEPGSPGEEFEPGIIRDINESDSDDRNGTNGDGESAYDISLNQTAVPGLPVEVTVTREDTPVGGAEVMFNGEPVGTTDDEGTLVATVPDTEELRISIDPPDLDVVKQAVAPAVGVPPTETAVDQFRPRGGVETGYSQEAPDNETVIEVSTDASVSVSGDPYAGTNVTVVATVAEVAIPDATVYLDGAVVGETDTDGRALIQLPERPGNSTLAIERGPVSGQTEIQIETVDLTVQTGLVALPLTGASVAVTAGEDGVANAPVVVDGTERTRTDADGTATVRLPLSSSARISTSQGGLTRQRTVDGLFRNAALVLAGVGLAVVIPAGLAYRRGYGLAELTRAIRGLGRRIKRAPGWLGQRVGWLLGSIAGRVSKTLVYVAGLASGRHALSDLRGALARWLGQKRAALQGILPGRGGDGTHKPAANGGEIPEDVPTIREAWDRFLEAIEADSPETMTPGELASEAIASDHPREPVETLRDVFRAVEYGNRDGSERDQRIREAIQGIESATAETPRPVERASADQTEETGAKATVQKPRTGETANSEPLHTDPPAGGDG